MLKKLINRISLVVILLMIILLDSFTYTQCPPEVLYYKFQNNCGTNLTPNSAIPGEGPTFATVVNQNFGPGGEFDTCLIGTGGVNNYLNTGWIPDIGSGNWTISFWVSDLVDLNPTYLFGYDSPGNIRCFFGGAAGSTSILFRGNFPDVRVCCIMPGPMVIHIVYDGSSIKTYKNGYLEYTFQVSGIDISGTGPLEIGGYANHNCMNSGGKLAEFRFYNRALSDAEIASTWNIQLSCITGVNNNSIPQRFGLYQNFPNPFNPMTKIKYDIPSGEEIGSKVNLTVYDILGREVATLVNENKQPGSYEVEWDGTNYPSGVYIYKLETEKYTVTKKMMLVK